MIDAPNNSYPGSESAELARRIESHVKHLANTNMNLPLGTWGQIANDLLDAARALRTGGVAQQTWMPIETAPKDGTVVEIVDADSGLPEVFYGHWAQNDGWGDDPVWLLGTPEMWAAGRSSWRATLGHKKNAAACLGVLTSPTHWRPRSQFTSTPSEPAQCSPDPVQDTWLVGGPDLKGMSGSVESNRVVQLHFRRPVTDADRKWLLDAINAKIEADGVAFPSTDRGGK